MIRQISRTFILASLALLAAVSCRNAAKEETRTPGYIVQVSMGEWDEQFYSTGDVISRIEEVTEIIPLEKVLVGWVSDPEPYRKIGEYLHSKGIQMLLYLPVLSETEGVCDNTPAVDIWGNRPTDYVVPQGSGFRFNCPTRKSNIDNLIKVYEENLADVDFDGVFLDRIRTQSFVCGVSGVLNCGCDSCAQRYSALGVDLADVRKAYEEKGDKFFSVRSYDPKKGFEFEDETAAAFFKAKGQIVSGSIARLCDYFHDRGMIVGLDLFAPLLAQFVGQDYSILAEHCDFIKPMLYRMTWAPAGIGFDYDLLRRSAPQAEGYPELEMDLDFLRGQLQAMEDLPCSKYPGIEIIYDSLIAPTTPEYIIESLNTVMDYGYDGAVVSWNIMQVPDEHIRCLNEVK
ncbi:MAG: putative glycoside hydrolase [Bacteroidales bacterium]|nr:putative glycoside hydrolase [Bacteroidales bacterium]